MPDFDITIKTPAELAGAIAAADALERDIGKAKALGQEFGALEAKLQKVRQSIADSKVPTEDAAGATEKLALSHRQLHGVLEQVAPGLAGIARFLTSGFAMAAGGAILLFQHFNQKLQDFNDFLDSIGNSANARGEWADKMREGLEKAGVEAAVYEHHLDTIAEAQQSLEKLADRALARDREKLASDNAIATAQRELAEARLQLAVKLGQVTEEQAIKIKLDIDEQFFKQQLQAKVAGIQAEINARTKQQAATIDQGFTAGERLPALKAAADAAGQAKIKNDEKLAQDKNNLDESVANQQKAIGVVDKLQGKGAWGGNWDKSDPQYWELKAAQEQVESEGRRQGALKAALTQGRAQQPGLDTAAATTKADYDAGKAKYEELIKSNAALTSQLADLNAKLAGTTAENKTLADLHNQTAAANAAAAAPAAFEHDVDTQIAKADAAAASARTAPTPGHIAALVASHERLVALFSEAQSHDQAHAAEIQQKISAADRKLDQLYRLYTNLR